MIDKITTVIFDFGNVMRKFDNDKFIDGRVDVPDRRVRKNFPERFDNHSEAFVAQRIRRQPHGNEAARIEPLAAEAVVRAVLIVSGAVAARPGAVRSRAGRRESLRDCRYSVVGAQRMSQVRGLDAPLGARPARRRIRGL